MARTVKDFDGVGEEVGDSVKGFDRAFGTSRKIHDDRPMPDDGDAAREDRGGRLLDTFAADFLGETGNATVGDAESSFRRIIARAESRATRR